MVGGHGRQIADEIYRGKHIVPDLIPKSRIEIAVNDDYVEIAVAAIMKAAQGGEIGDGKIFITPLEECIRIRTGERGGEAI